MKRLMLAVALTALVAGVGSTGPIVADDTEPVPFPMCGEFRDIVLHCPADATGCAGLGTYGGTSFIITAEPGSTARDRICVEEGNRTYGVRATPGTFTCFPEIGEARTVSYRCAGANLQIH